MRIDLLEWVVGMIRAIGQALVLGMPLAAPDVLGAALKRKRTEQALRESQAELTYARDEMSFLAEAGSVLASSLDYETTLAIAARLAVPRIADWCAVDVIGTDGSLQRLEVAHRDPDKVERAREARRRYPPDPNDPHGIPHVLRTGRSEIYCELPQSLVEASARDEWHRRVLQDMGLRSAMIVPIVARGRTIGTISFALAESGRHYRSADLALAEELARLAAMAVDNARLYHDAEKAIRARDEFLSVAAHELKTPITSLRGFTQLALRGLAKAGETDSTETRQRLQMVDHHSKKLARLVCQLLDVSRMEARRLTLDRRTVDVVKLAHTVVAAARADGDGHTFEVKAPRPATAVVDPTLMERVLANLVDNAIRYSPGGGPIEVEVTPVEAGTVSIAVRDWGISIQPEHRDHIFDRYYQAHTSDNLGGLGLGLYICREIVNLHGGRIELETPADGGSRFVVTLPTGFCNPAEHSEWRIANSK